MSAQSSRCICCADFCVESLVLEFESLPVLFNVRHVYFIFLVSFTILSNLLILRINLHFRLRLFSVNHLFIWFWTLIILICLIYSVLTILAIHAILRSSLRNFFEPAFLIEWVWCSDRRSILGDSRWSCLQIVFSGEMHLLHFAERHCSTGVVNLLSWCASLVSLFKILNFVLV